jgi:ribosomal protein S27AE
MIGLAAKNRSINLMKKTCPKCGYVFMRMKRACCSERRRGIKGRAICPKCGYKMVIK